MNQEELATLKRRQAAFAANGQADEADKVGKELAKFESTARNVRKRAADAETATDTAVSDDAEVEKATARRR